MGELGVLIPILIFSIPLVWMWTEHKQKMAKLRLAETAENAALHAAHAKELEERVRVLERIVTDKGADVAAQIEALREPAPVSTREQV
jgi:anti-sigma regulatory factor (Ser/Thr protein kinase)